MAGFPFGQVVGTGSIIGTRNMTLNTTPFAMPKTTNVELVSARQLGPGDIFGRGPKTVGPKAGSVVDLRGRMNAAQIGTRMIYDPSRSLEGFGPFSLHRMEPRARRRRVRGRNGVAVRGTHALDFGAEHLGDVGFSLKPPSWARKAVTSVVKEVKHLATIKNLAIVGGTLLAAPVVLPALAAGAGVVGTGLRVAGGFIAKEAGGLVTGLLHHGSGGVPGVPFGPPAPSDSYNPGAPPMSPIANAALNAPAYNPVAVDSAGNPVAVGAGGAYIPSSADIEAQPDTSAPTTAQASTGAGMSPVVMGLLAVGAAVAIGAALHHKRRSRKAS